MAKTNVSERDLAIFEAELKKSLQGDLPWKVKFQGRKVSAITTRSYTNEANVTFQGRKTFETFPLDEVYAAVSPQISLLSQEEEQAVDEKLAEYEIVGATWNAEHARSSYLKQVRELEEAMETGLKKLRFARQRFETGYHSVEMYSMREVFEAVDYVTRNSSLSYVAQYFSEYQAAEAKALPIISSPLPNLPKE